MGIKRKAGFNFVNWNPTSYIVLNTIIYAVLTNNISFSAVIHTRGSFDRVVFQGHFCHVVHLDSGNTCTNFKSATGVVEHRSHEHLCFVLKVFFIARAHVNNIS